MPHRCIALYNGGRLVHNDQISGGDLASFVFYMQVGMQVQHTTTQHITQQHSTARHNTAQHSTAQQRNTRRVVSCACCWAFPYAQAQSTKPAKITLHTLPWSE